jgi:hypothetical protein
VVVVEDEKTKKVRSGTGYHFQVINFVVLHHHLNHSQPGRLTRVKHPAIVLLEYGGRRGVKL